MIMPAEVLPRTKSIRQRITSAEESLSLDMLYSDEAEKAVLGCMMRFVRKGSSSVIVKISSCDVDIFDSKKWYLGTDGYIQSHFYKGKKRSTISLHRALLGNPIGVVVDHINGDRLDYQRKNLRICSSFENAKNRGVGRKSKSGFIGVSWFSPRKKWRVCIWHEGRQKSFGLYLSAVAAAKARDKIAKSLLGEFCRLNFPNES